MRTVLFDADQFCDIRRTLSPIATLIAASVLLSACSFRSDYEVVEDPPADTDVRIASQWDSPFGRLGVVPVLPPNEDVRVGDIYAYAFNPDVQIWQDNLKRRVGIAISPRWDSLNLLDELDAEYRTRPDWPEAPFDASRAALETSAAQGQGLYSGSHAPRRLRSFGMPELSTFLLPDGDLNYLVPSETINLVLGSAWNDNKAVSIRINAAETYSLGMRKIIAAVLEESDSGTFVREPFRSHLTLMADPSSDSIWLRILSDVVYVRSIDIIIQSKAGFDEDEAVLASEFVADTEETVTITKAKADDSEQEVNAEAETLQGEASTENSEYPEQAEILHTETVSETLPDHVLDPAFAAFVRANAINELLTESHVDDLSASFLRFVSVTDDSVTVRRTWSHGLAIGARGLALEVSKESGRVFRSANMGALIP